MKDILVVEDGKVERERITQLFLNSGYSVVACSSVAEAEQELKVNEFKLSILDVGLSDKSGSYLFDAIKRSGRSSYVAIMTGNPSVHLKQRFIEEGAVDYIIKGSPQAQNEQLLRRIEEIIGPPQSGKVEGGDFLQFMNTYLDASSRAMFLEMDNSLPKCTSCQGKNYVIVFNHKPQLPPEVYGMVMCASCGRPLEPEVA